MQKASYDEATVSSPSARQEHSSTDTSTMPDQEALVALATSHVQGTHPKHKEVFVQDLDAFSPRHQHREVKTYSLDDAFFQLQTNVSKLMRR